MKYVWAVLMAVAMAGAVQAQTAAPAPKLPDAVLGVVEAANLDAAQQHIQAYVASVSPGVPVEEGLAGIIGELAMTTDPTLVDTSAPFRILFMKGANGSIRTEVLFNSKAPAAFGSSVNPQLKKGETKDGVTTYTLEKRNLDWAAFGKATPEERQDFGRFMKTTQVPYAVGVEGKVICVGGEADAVRATLALVRNGSLKPEAILGTAGDMNAFFRMDALSQHLSAAPGGMFGSLRESMKAMMSMNPAGAGNPAMGAAVIGMELDALEGVASQMQSAQARLSFDAQDARLSLVCEARPQTVLANFIASVPNGKPDTLKYLPPDAQAVGYVKLGNQEIVSASMNQFMRKFYTAMGTDPAKVEELASAAGAMTRAGGTEFSIALGPGSGMNIVEAFRLKDPAKYQELMKAWPDMMKSLTAGMGGMGMTVALDPEPVKYKDHEIKRWTFSFPKPAEGDRMAEMQARTMRAVFGENPGFSTVLLGNDQIIAMGDGSLDQIKQVIDRGEKPAMDNAALKAAVAGIPADNAGFAWFRLSRLVEMQSAMMRAAMPADRPMPQPQPNFQPGPGIIAFLTTNGPAVNVTLRVPAAEVKSVVDGMKAARNAAPLGGAAAQPPPPFTPRIQAPPPAAAPGK